MKIIDAHTHFFSYTWLEHFFNLARHKFAADEGVEALARLLNWDVPPSDPRDLGKRWVQEQDKYGLTAQVIFASKLNDAEFLTAATRAFPERLLGYVMIDPTQPDARNATLYSLHILDMKGVLLFPAMHHFHANDRAVYTVYEEALAAGAPVFIHFGQLSIPIFQKLGLPDNIDLRFSNPLDLMDAARDLPEVTFIIPHFGCGRFEEALQVAEQCPNVHLDTSSSNSWIQPPLTLEEVFKRSLEVLGPERLLFGTDSSFFPRGWRKEIFDRQLAILDSLHVAEKDKALIFGENIARILNLR